MSDYYKESLDHLHDELLLVDLLIYAQVIKFRALRSHENRMPGLYISEEEVDELLKGNSAYEKWVDNSQSVNDEYEKITAAIHTLSLNIKTKLENSRKMGIIVKLEEMTQLYGLSTFETEIFTICLAPEFDNKYRKLFAYLQDDVTQKNPGVELLLNLICATFKEKTIVRKSLSPQSPLFKNNVLEFIYNPHEPETPLLAKSLKVNTRIVAYLLNDNRVDDEIHDFASFHPATGEINDFLLPPEIAVRFKHFIRYFNYRGEKRNFIFSLSGPDDTGHFDVAETICRKIEAPLLVADLYAMYSSGIFFERAVNLLLRESKINFSAIFLKNCDFLFDEFFQEGHLKNYLIDCIDKESLLTFFSSREPLPLYGMFRNQKFISIDIPVPGYKLRKDIWESELKETKLDPSVNIKELAGKYNLTSGRIRNIVDTAGVFALWRLPEDPVINLEDIRAACDIHSNQRLGQLAMRIKPKHTWDDLILKAEIKDTLKELVKMFHYKHVVYNEWGFDDKLSLGKGISALFSGEPGTGKTLAAEIIAHELGMDLYKIDISTVVSKYIGETEKNLSQIFHEAESSNAILFFDEADAIFGKRTEVRDSHDRYSNIEVSYLLQRIDEYNGVVIMATNFNQNIDSAFQRRIHFSVYFPFPDEQSRLGIWQNIFPGKTPVSESIKFDILAKKLEICGGSIRNIALQAAFFAADQPGNGDKIIGTNEILKACYMEYKKIGRLWDDTMLTDHSF